MADLTHALVTAPSATPSRWMLFLHGILGSGSNWRTFAKKFVEQRPEWGAVLVDLRNHGGSQNFPPPHTLAACAADLRALQAILPKPAVGILGHSFGGKVALEYLRGDPNVEVAWILDSTPSARPDARGSESTMRIVSLLERLPSRFPTRESFIEQITAAGNDRAIAMWLAMQVKPADDRDGYEWRLDLNAIRSMMNDYFDRDEWVVLENKLSSAKIHVVIGGRSSVFDSGDRARISRLAETSDRISFHILPNSGHWVHVDAPNELLELVVTKSP